MRKIVAFSALGLILMTSCKKNHVCQCVYTDGDTDTYNIVNEKKGSAKNLCSAKSSQSKVCDLK